MSLIQTLPTNNLGRDFFCGDLHGCIELSPVYSGHTIVQRPVRVKQWTNLDTGAWIALSSDTRSWSGLTVAEPRTDSFWLTNKNGILETGPVGVA